MKIFNYIKFIRETKTYKRRWTKEKCAEEALKYKSKSEFKRSNINAYNVSIRNEWISDICLHMGENKIKNNYWTKEKCAEEALKYNSKTDFEKGSSSAYVKSGKMGWKDEICSHMISNGNLYNRCVYAVEFPDNHVYIGLSYDSDKRFSQHLSDIKNASRRNKWMDEICSHMNFKLKKWDNFSCREEARKFKNRDQFKKNSSGAFGYAYNNNLLDELFPKSFKLSENVMNIHYNLPSYEDCVEICSIDESPFYESKVLVDGYNVSLFNYRLANYNDFLSKPFAKEMRGLCFVFNKDGSVFKRYILLEKFFNLNQVPETLYSIVKNYKIKFINNKEDGSIASFIKLPNGKVVGRSKMGFDNDQADGINRVYKTNKDVKLFVDYVISMDYTPVFEFVAPNNRIVLRYPSEELILLRLRDNKTGKHIDIRNHLDKVGSIRVAPFEDEIRDLDHLIELNATQVDKEGSIVTCEDEYGRDFFFKLKTPWYMSLHGLLTDDIYKENIIISNILDDKIDDILGQIPEDEKEAHERINKIISIVKKDLRDKVDEINKAYKEFVNSGMSKRDYAINHRVGNPNFAFVMNMDKAEQLKKMSKEEILDIYDDMESYESSLKRCEPFEMAKEFIRDKTKRLAIARDWLQTNDKTLFFQDPEESEDDN